MKTTIAEQIKTLLRKPNADGSYWYNQSDIVKGIGRNQAGVSKAMSKLLESRRDNYICKDIGGIKHIAYEFQVGVSDTPLEISIKHSQCYARLLGSVRHPSITLEQAKKAEKLLEEAFYIFNS